MQITQVMTTPIINIDNNATAMQAAKVMVDHQVNSLLVVSGRTPVGILTQNDVLSCHKIRLTDIQIKDLRLRPIMAVNNTISCEEAIRKMIIHNRRKLLVTNDEGQVGLFTLTNLQNSSQRR